MDADLSSPIIVAYQVVRNSITQKTMDVNTILSCKMGEIPMLQLAIFLDDNQFITYLLSHGVDTNQTSKCWGTALHQAVKMQKYKLVKKLVKAGVNLTACDPRNRDFTPLHIAIEDNCYKIAKILVNYGADVEVLSTIKNDFGDSLLQIALKSKDEKMINLLLKNIRGSRKKLTCRALKLLMKGF
ncbi:ankyrin repeat domain-containing protein 1-like [Cotesia glomerata]|uniref:ankyrin repeat domain-containing protein 1-like n=1 Tax=Cotesia glomerata TaxID=32391 RepID=UPI001D012101|nr:ankyrin repeat domain-containing protein 1-like [Cotesia glomerata]